MTRPTYWILLFPSFNQPSGGVLQLHRFAECLRDLNRSVYIVQDDPDFKPSWFHSGVNTVSTEDWNLGNNLDPSSNVVVVPETFARHLPLFAPGVPKIIYNQNVSYTFGLPDSNKISNPTKILRIYNHPDVSKICCVSEYDYAVLNRLFSISTERLCLIRNQIASPDEPSDPIKLITYMPRKNTRDSFLINFFLELSSSFSGWQILPLSGLNHANTLNMLAQSSLFLSFGHPEGFGMPLAESLLAHTPIIGYSGLGGREIFSIAKTFGVGWEVEYGDHLGFLTAFEHFNSALENSSVELQKKLSSAALVVSSLYSRQSMLDSVGALISSLESNLVDD